MIETFNLPVSDDSFVCVTYQKPDAPDGKAVAKTPVKPLIIMMHGFPGGHKAGCGDLFGELEYRFEGMGYPSVRFDFRGWGESHGKPEDFTLETALEDLRVVINWAKDKAGYRSFVLLGESGGAAVAVMGYDPKLVSGLILLWPALKLKETSFKALLTKESQNEADKADLPYVMFEGQRLGTPFLNEIYQNDLTATLEGIAVPVMVQHGTADEEVPVEQAYFARDTLPNLTDLGIFEGGGHGLHSANMREHMYVNIRHFLGRVFKKLDPAP